MKNLISEFKEVFGDEICELRCARAPGRVNLIGEHTDYNGGFVLPMAIDRDMRIVFRPAEGKKVRMWSMNYEEFDEFDVTSPHPDDDRAWSNYVRGVAWALQEAGLPVRAFEGVLCGNVPIGAGLSSSAAFEVAASMALCPEKDLKAAGQKRIALICQKAENEFVGVNCGIMDQFVSIHAERDHAVLIDCRSLDYTLLPLDTEELTVLVGNTMAEHELGNSAYNERRSTCEQTAAKINEKVGGIAALRDVSAGMLEKYRGILSDTEYKRAKHVISENDRANRAVDALGERNYNLFGKMMIESHKSLRYDYEVSCDELDIMVDIALQCEGVYGSRMTGAGFGGCTVNLVRREKSEEVAENMHREYKNRTGIKPDIFKFKAAEGAGLGSVEKYD